MQWEFNGNTVEFQWKYSGNAMKKQCKFSGNAMEIQWKCNGNTVEMQKICNKNAMEKQQKYGGKAIYNAMEMQLGPWQNRLPYAIPRNAEVWVAIFKS